LVVMVHFFHLLMFVSYLFNLEYIQRYMTEDKHQQILMNNMYIYKEEEEKK